MINNTIDDYNPHILRDSIVIGLYFIVAIFAILGNLFVLVVIKKSPRLKTTTFTILSNLAVVDILGGLSILLQFIFCSHTLLEQDKYFLRICGFTKSLQILSYFVSTYCMLFIAVDRFLQLKYLDSKIYFKPTYAIILSWLIGGLFNLTTFVNLRINEFFRPNYNLISCRVAFIHPKLTISYRKIRIVLLISTQYLIPLILTGILYYKIWIIIKRNSKEAITQLNQKQIMYQINSKKRTIIMLIVVVLAFALAWLPVHTIHIINFFIYPLVNTKCNSSTLYVLTYWLGISSVCYNPLIYYWSNSIFRDELNNLLYLLKITKNRNQIQEENMIERQYSKGSITNYEDL